MATIPGAYPTDPATPDEPPVVPQRHRPLDPLPHRHDQHEHAKSHKPEDPRGHKQTDSAVGMMETGSTSHEPAQYQPAELPATNLFIPPSDVNLEPSSSTSSPKDNGSYTFTHPNIRSEGPADERGDASSLASSGSKDKDVTTPYWGNLPKAMTGGIYNTVMGHGSAKDDHDHHHHLPEKSTPSRAHIAEDTSDHPKGGVYNTVTGHGSVDEESKRHNLPPVVTLPQTKEAAPEALGTTHAPRMTEETPVSATSGPLPGPDLTHKPTESPMIPGVAAAAIPVSAQQPFNSAGPSASESSYARRVNDQAPLASQRAFPLSTSDQDKRRQSADDAQRDSVYFAHRGEKPKKLQKPRETTFIEEPRRRSMGQSPDNKTQGFNEDRHSTDRERRPREKSTDSGSATSSGRKKHGIFGVFHRRKDSKEMSPVSRESSADGKELPPATKEPLKNDGNQSAHHDHHDRHSTQKTAATAAAAAGMYGMMQHEKTPKEKDNRAQPEPMAAKKDAPATQHRETVPTILNATAPSAFENPRAAPSAPIDALATKTDRSMRTPSPKAAAVGDNTMQDEGDDVSLYNKLPSGTPSGVKLGTMGHRSSAGSRTGAVEGRDAHGDGQNKSLALGAPSGFTASYGHQHHDASHRSDDASHYKKLSSGTDSGVAATHSDGYHGSSRQSNDSSHYKKLATGTASGVAAAAVAHHHRQDRTEDPEYNTLASGTPSGVNPEHAHRHSDSEHKPSQQTTAASGVHAQQVPSDQYDNLGSAKSSFKMPPMPIRTKQPLETVPEPRTEPRTEPKTKLTTFPSPEQAKQMSPEVMPEAYTSSVPRAGSPKETSSAPRSFAHEQSTEPRESRSAHHSSVHPALAAATGAWASTAGPTSGNASASTAGKVLHKCQHCGGDNDITQDITEAMNKMNSKQGSNAGNGSWWHNAWTNS